MAAKKPAKKAAKKVAKKAVTKVAKKAVAKKPVAALRPPARDAAKSRGRAR